MKSITIKPKFHWTTLLGVILVISLFILLETLAGSDSYWQIPLITTAIFCVYWYLRYITRKVEFREHTITYSALRHSTTISYAQIESVHNYHSVFLGGAFLSIRYTDALRNNGRIFVLGASDVDELCYIINSKRFKM